MYVVKIVEMGWPEQVDPDRLVAVCFDVNLAFTIAYSLIVGDEPTIHPQIKTEWEKVNGRWQQFTTISERGLAHEARVEKEKLSGDVDLWSSGMPRFATLEEVPFRG